TCATWANVALDTPTTAIDSPPPLLGVQHRPETVSLRNMLHIPLGRVQLTSRPPSFTVVCTAGPEQFLRRSRNSLVRRDGATAPRADHRRSPWNSSTHLGGPSSPWRSARRSSSAR